jgi:ketosteroid isomerase-like protein
MIALVLSGALLAATPAAADDLIAIEQARSKAIAAHDAAFLTDLYADDFSGVTSSGVEVDKATLMGVFARTDGRLAFSLEGLKSRPLDADTTLVSGVLVAKDASGVLVGRQRYLHVYEKRQGRWRLVGGQSTPETAKAG